MDKTDLISINSFGGLKGLPEQLKNSSWFWKDPYMILEWGIKGPWRPNEDITSWESYIESTSSKKGKQYLQTYKEYIPLNDPRLLGSFVFYWGPYRLFSTVYNRYGNFATCNTPFYIVK